MKKQKINMNYCPNDYKNNHRWEKIGVDREMIIFQCTQCRNCSYEKIQMLGNLFPQKEEEQKITNTTKITIKHNLNHHEIQIIKTIATSSIPFTINEITKKTNYSWSTVKQYIQTLEKKGYIKVFEQTNNKYTHYTLNQ